MSGWIKFTIDYAFFLFPNLDFTVLCLISVLRYRKFRQKVNEPVLKHNLAVVQNGQQMTR